MSDTILCPHCNCEMEVTEVLSAQLRSQWKKEFDAEFRRKEAAIVDREKEVVKANQDIDRRVSEQLAKERKQLSQEAIATARDQVNQELRDKDEQLVQATTRLKASQEVELALRKERRDLEEADARNYAQSPAR